MRTVAELLPAHLPLLGAFLRRKTSPLLRQQESSSDLVQSVCREALQAPPQVAFATEAQFAQWLLAIARTKLIDRHRRHCARKRSPGGPAASAEVAADRGPSPSQAASQSEQAARVADALAQLSEVQQRVIFLARMAGLSHAAVSEAIGRSPLATRQILSRAMAQLGARLAGLSSGRGHADDTGHREPGRLLLAPPGQTNARMA